jgi:predicted amidohydrolase YtcJ
MRNCSATYGKGRRWRIEHFQIVDPADIPRLKPAGIIASMQPTHQTSDRLMAEARLGKDRLKGAYAWQTVERVTVPVAFGSDAPFNASPALAFGSDFPVESPNPFPGLSAAVSRQDINGQPPGGWRPEERVSLEQALAGFTRGAAYAGFAEGKIGGLEPGKWAISSLSIAMSARPIRKLWPARRCWRRGSRERKSGRRSLAPLLSAVAEHPGRQYLRQLVCLRLAGRVP